MRYFKHSMVIGGTGMLSEASIQIARRSESLTSIARTEESLASIDEAVSGANCHHEMVAQDYDRAPEMCSVVRDAIRKTGPVELLVMWIHDEGTPLPLAIGEIISEAGIPFRVVHILGSAAGDPLRASGAVESRLTAFANITYQQVILGFNADSDGSRWLTHDEISAGVVSAVDSGSSRSIVGQIEPWDLRP